MSVMESSRNYRRLINSSICSRRAPLVGSKQLLHKRGLYNSSCSLKWDSLNMWIHLGTSISSQKYAKHPERGTRCRLSQCCWGMTWDPRAWAGMRQGTSWTFRMKVFFPGLRVRNGRGSFGVLKSRIAADCCLQRRFTACDVSWHWRHWGAKILIVDGNSAAQRSEMMLRMLTRTIPRVPAVCIRQSTANVSKLSLAAVHQHAGIVERRASKCATFATQSSMSTSALADALQTELDYEKDVNEGQTVSHSISMTCTSCCSDLRFATKHHAQFMMDGINTSSWEDVFGIDESGRMHFVITSPFSMLKAVEIVSNLGIPSLVQWDHLQVEWYPDW